MISAPSTVFSFATPQFPVAAVVSMTIVMLVVLCETTAGILAVGEIVETKVDSRRLGDGLRADMVSTTLRRSTGWLHL
jgi:xanthine/uracil permease